MNTQSVELPRVFRPYVLVDTWTCNANGTPLPIAASRDWDAITELHAEMRDANARDTGNDALRYAVQDGLVIRGKWIGA